MSAKYSNGEYKTAWKGTTSITTKEWGKEVNVGSLHQINVKIIVLEAGKSTSFKYYSNKNEMLFIRSGSAQIKYASEEYFYFPQSAGIQCLDLSVGDVFFVQSGCPYTITAMTDCEIFEIGDNVRALPTKIEEQKLE